jgi:hypothetical protein
LWAEESTQSSSPASHHGKGTAKIQVPRLPLLDCFLPEDHLDEPHLLGYSTYSGVPSIDGKPENSSKRFSVSGRDGEGYKEIGCTSKN